MKNILRYQHVFDSAQVLTNQLNQTRQKAVILLRNINTIINTISKTPKEIDENIAFESSIDLARSVGVPESRILKKFKRNR